MVFTAAVAGTAAALGAVTLKQFAGSEPGKDVEISSDAVAKTIGVAMCLPADSWRKALRHVTVIGDILVLSRKPGSADSTLSLSGAHIDVIGSDVKVVSLTGSTIATFWLNSAEEASRWAQELDPAQKNMAKMLSLNRVQMESIRAEAAIWEEKIKMANDSKTHRERLLVEVAEKEKTVKELSAEIENFKDLPKALSLDRRQMEELERASKDKEGQLASLQEQLTAFQAMPKMMSINRKQIAELEHKAVSEKGQIADLQEELKAFQDMEKKLAVQREKVQQLEDQKSKKDNIIDNLKSRVSHFQDIPKMLSVRRVEAEKKEVDADARIEELERQVAQAEAIPRMLSLNRRQAADLVQKSCKYEEELSALRRQLLAKQASEMMKPRVISKTTRVYEGPKTVVSGTSPRSPTSFSVDKTTRSAIGA
jgi:myosin heavy subunit